MYVHIFKAMTTSSVKLLRLEKHMKSPQTPKTSTVMS